MKKATQLFLAAVLALLPVFSFAPVTHAQTSLGTSGSGVDIGDGLDEVGTGAGLSESDLPTVIGTLINIFLSILGIIFLVLVLYAGFLWMTAAGDSGKVDKAKTLLTQAIIGLILILASYAIANFVVDAISRAGL